MDVKRGRMVFLGYGKYWRSDRILGLMPIEEGRGPGQRTNVFIEGRPEPVVASRTEQSILEDMAATDDSFRLEALREATRELLTASQADRGWFGHPRGLSTLFFTEMWERFSFYGLRALLVLYMTAAVADGGLAFTSQKASGIVGWYGC